MKKLTQTIVGVFLSLVFINGHAETLMDRLTPGSTVRHIVLPFYHQPDLKLCAVIEVEKASLDYQRRGFFHIGILPKGVLDGVTFEFHDTRFASDTFQQIQRWLGVGGGRIVELRHVKFVCSTNTLEAAKVECRDGSHWELLDGVRLVCCGYETRARRATLEISGKAAGRLVLEETPQETNSFLGLATIPEH